MPQIFLSYRRQDNDHALSLYLWLIKKYGRESVFWDRKDIDPGLKFADVIELGLDKCAVFLALIGKGWLEIQNEQGGRKIDSPEDWVRRETAIAMERNILVLPVLGSGAKMPGSKDLPDEIAKLSGLQALSMTDMRFHSLLAESLAQAGVVEQKGPPVDEPAARIAQRAGNLLRRQAGRLQIRSKELIRSKDFDRAFEELNEGTELMMALLDLVPGEAMLDLQLGYVYAALGQYFNSEANSALADRYMELAAGIFSRVRDEVASDPDATGELASAIKGLGEVYYKRGDYDAASEHYRQALEILPTYSYAWHDLFGALVAQGRRGRVNLTAMRLALKMTRETGIGPTGPHAGLGDEYLKELDGWMAEAEERVKKYPHLEVGAEERYTAEIADNADNPTPYLGRAKARVAAQKNAGAIEDYTAAIEHGYDRADAYLQRAYLRAVVNDYGGAEADFTAAMERGEKGAEIYIQRGHSRLQVKNAKEAEADFTTAIELGQAAYFARATARLSVPDLKGAEADFTTSIEAGQKTGESLFLRGLLRSDRKDFAGAAADYAAAIENGRNDADVHMRLADARIALDDAKGAEPEYTAAIEAGNTKAAVYLKRAMARARQGETAGAASDFATAIAGGADDPFFHYLLGKMRVLNGEAEAAEKSLDTAIARGYGEAVAYYWRGRARLDRDHHADAEADFDKAIEGGDEEAEVYYHRGKARLMLARLQDAAMDLTVGIAKGYEPRLAHFTRAFVNYYLGTVDGTYEDCSKAIEAGLEMADLYRMRAHAAARSEKLEQAEADCKKADELEPGAAGGLACWGELHMARGEFAKAAESFGAAAEAEPDNMRWRFALGLNLLLDGHADEARTEYTKGVERADAMELRIARVELDHWTKDRPEAAAGIRPMLQGEQPASAPV